MADVYLIYSHHDRVAAERIAAALREARLTVWFAPSLHGNDVNVDQLLRELTSAAAAVVLWSTQSAKSEWVKREVDAADRLVSVYLEPIRRQIHGGMHLA